MSKLLFDTDIEKEESKPRFTHKYYEDFYSISRSVICKSFRENKIFIYTFLDI